MAAFVALYSGRTISDARMVGVTADNDLVGYVAAKLLEDKSDIDADDPVSEAIEDGRRRALTLIRGTAEATAR